MGRQEDPLHDAAVLVAVRQVVGPGVALRADANRKWSLNQAVAFGHVVKAAGLQVSHIHTFGDKLQHIGQALGCCECQGGLFATKQDCMWRKFDH